MLEQSDQHAKVMEKNNPNLVRNVSNYTRRGRGGTTRERTAARRGFDSQNRGNFRETGQSYQRGNYRRALPTINAGIVDMNFPTEVHLVQPKEKLQHVLISWPFCAILRAVVRNQNEAK
jgi:hypothetical protein